MNETYVPHFIKMESLKVNQENVIFPPFEFHRKTQGALIMNLKKIDFSAKMVQMEHMSPHIIPTDRHRKPYSAPRNYASKHGST